MLVKRYYAHWLPGTSQVGTAILTGMFLTFF